MNAEEIIIDGKNMVMGRLASYVAKELLKGRRVAVVNAEKIIITGTSKNSILRTFLEKLQRRSNVNPRRHGPFVPRSPDRLFRRIVRGMLPRHKFKGKSAYRRLKVYLGVPETYLNKSIITVEEARYKGGAPYYMYLGEICRHIGWMPVEEKLKGW